jgi:RNA-directed DNA polymerase
MTLASNAHPVQAHNLTQKLFDSYKRCIKHKSHIKDTPFHLYHETWIARLAKEILAGKYQPRKSSVFVVTRPKPREIIAAHILDRIVHHLICQHMEPWWERRFDTRSFACRVGKGALAASLDLRNFIRGYQAFNSAPLWYLKVDVKAFFPSIDRQILEDLVVPKISNPLIQGLVRTTIRHNPLAPNNYRLASSPRLLALVPPHKSLFTVSEGKGLPIGNLSSQFFANVYMNELDQHLARHAPVKPLYWQRYVDDIVCLDQNPQRLKAIARDIEDFLNKNLKLSLHPQKTILQPLARGLDHLGYFHLPNRTYPRKRVIKAAAHVINLSALGPDDDLNDLIPRINSYLGHFGHADSFHLRQQICKTISQYDVGRTCVVRGDYSSLKNTAVAKLRNQVLNTTISDIFSQDFSADSEEIWDYEDRHFTEI